MSPWINAFVTAKGSTQRIECGECAMGKGHERVLKPLSRYMIILSNQYYP